MSSLVGALPEQHSKEVHPTHAELHRLQTFPSNVPFGYVAQQQIPPFAGATPTNAAGYGTYAQQYASPFQPGASAAQAYGQPPSGHQSHSGGPSPNPQFYTGQQYFPPPQQAPTYLYYPGQYGPPGGQQQHAVQPQGGPYSASYTRPAGYPYGPVAPSHHDADARTVAGRFPSHGVLGPGSAAPYGYQSGGSFLRPGSAPGKLIRFFWAARSPLTRVHPRQRSVKAVQVQVERPSHPLHEGRLGSPNNPAMRSGWAIFPRAPTSRI